MSNFIFPSHQADLLHILIINFLKCYLIIAGDSGYPLERHLMVPVSDPHTQAEEKYNKALQNKSDCDADNWHTQELLQVMRITFLPSSIQSKACR